MNLQQAVQFRSSTNGFGRRKVDREMGTRIESRLLPAKTSSGNFSNAGLFNGSKVGVQESPSRDRLIFVSTCLVGHPVDVHVKNGSILSGIFHAANTEKDFGIVLKMARVTKDGTLRGQKPVLDTVKRPQTMIIPARELVQVIAKDVSLSSDGFSNGHVRDKRQDLMIDSVISQSHHAELERELERWTPDKDDPQCPELENIFDGTWNRNWDQFETNETLFGVKSTFDEELYTTKLERGPQMRELEREALRIAREIEGEDTQDLHLAEERGIQFDEEFDLDEESKFSSVYRGVVDDGMYEENLDTVLDASNTETFGGSLSSIISRSFSDTSQSKTNDGAQASSSGSSLDEEGPSLNSSGRNVVHPDSMDHVRQSTPDFISKNFSPVNDDSRLDEDQIGDQNGGKNLLDEYTKRTAFEETQTTRFEEIQPSMDMRKSSFDKGGLSVSAIANASSLAEENKGSLAETSESAEFSKSSGAALPANPRGRPASSTSSTSERVCSASAISGPGLSPSSSVGSLSSEKSTLNPYAKEFKLNPNAKSFTPSASLRPHAPAPESSFYYANVSAVPHMHALPMSMGIGPSFGGHQPVVYNPQAVQMQAPQAYANPNGPLYGQQMFLGQPRPVLYMPNYPPEMPYKGRDF